MKPVQTTERVGLLDSFRGFALLGILMVNMGAMAWPLFHTMGVSLDLSGSDLWVNWTLRFLFESKFYVIFSFLFGVGMAVQMERCQANGRPFVRFFAKRLMWLFLFGLLHAVFVWSGDILVTYAIVGVGLLFYRNKSAKALMVRALVLLFLTLAALIGGIWVMKTMGAKGQSHIFLEMAMAQENILRTGYDHALKVMAEGSYADMVAVRMSESLLVWANIPVSGMFVLLAFMFGAAAWKSGFLQNIENNRVYLVRFLMFALPIGLFGSAIYTWSKGFGVYGAEGLMGVAGMLVSQYALGYSYLALLALLYLSGRAKPLFDALAPMGRMALTNYLTHSIVATLIFNNYGLGLVNQFSEAGAVLLVIAIYGVQIPLSKWWLTHYRFGPFEWLWRSLTYSKLQPMRREVTATA